jgi:hypothetical protein
MSRMASAEKKINVIDKKCVELKIVKCDDIEFKTNLERINQSLLDLDSKVDRNENHCTALDNYLDKY